MCSGAWDGFAAGVMVAASVWSLLIPAIEESVPTMGRLAFLPAVIGFWVGTGFLLLLDVLIPHLHLNRDAKPEGLRSHLQRTTMMILAVTLHNIPEGMAVGMIYAGFYWIRGPFPSAVRRRCLWALPSKISQKEPSFPCPLKPPAWENTKPL